MVWAAFALALAATAARAETKIVLPDDSGSQEAPKTPPPPPKVVQPQDSAAMTALQSRVDQLQGQNDALQKKHAELQSKFDSSKGAAGATDATASTPTGTGASKPNVPAPNMSRAEPPAIPDQDGDKKGKDFGSNAKKTAGTVGEVVKPLGVTLGAGLFLFGVMALFLGPAMAAMGPALMVGGAIVAVASVLIGGLLQGSSK
jgi:hypothetical protein